MYMCVTWADDDVQIQSRMSRAIISGSAAQPEDGAEMVVSSSCWRKEYQQYEQCEQEQRKAAPARVIDLII